jgi:prolyl-tRNA editing enzyme YbaK/EbsC (Cys-tRNA(Pro) deacylase)
VSTIIEYLQGRGVAFTVLPTPQSESALDTVRGHSVPVEELAKVVPMSYRYGSAMMVIPAHASLDVALAQAALDDPDAQPATLRELATHFSGFDPANIPPLGLYFLAPMWVDPEVAGREYIAFAAGRPSLVIRMNRADLFRDDPFVVTPLSVVDVNTPAADDPAVPAADIA